MEQEKQKTTYTNKGGWGNTVTRKDYKDKECIRSYDGSHQSTDVPKDKAKSPVRER